MSREFTIRPAEPGDAAELVALANEVGAEPGGWLITTTNWRTVNDERRYLRSLRRYPHAAVYVAEAEEGSWATLGRPRPAPREPSRCRPRPDGRAEPPAPGRGPGAARGSRYWARSRGVTKLELHVFPHNEGAIALYDRFGFEREGYRKRHYRRPDGYVDAILMAYEVT